MAVWEAQETGPLECTMQIYENNMQIRIVLVIQYKQTNDGKEFDYCALRRIPDLTCRVAQVCGYLCVCVCVCPCNACMCVCVSVHAHACGATQDK